MAQRAPPRRPCVLLVEDEPLLRFMLADFIEDAGCEAVEAVNATEAVGILETRDDIRVVVADLDVRGSLMGLRLAAMVRERWPPIELILTGAVRPDVAAIPARGVFHGKPFDERRFIESIRSFAM
ncbi:MULTISPECIES: response regulator [Methylobacterium]|uniref:response regulator n=1 Tax=Methylobacterium TaxID=407 RepID=UPI00272DD7CF|nr:response regulator [Methylobacterium sp.]